MWPSRIVVEVPSWMRCSRRLALAALTRPPTGFLDAAVALAGPTGLLMYGLRPESVAGPVCGPRPRRRVAVGLGVIVAVRPAAGAVPEILIEPRPLMVVVMLVPPTASLTDPVPVTLTVYAPAGMGTASGVLPTG